jgi:hypothetical protein
MSKRLLSMWLVAVGLWGPVVGPAVGQGTITVVLPQPLGMGSDGLHLFFYPIDINGDGVVDFTFAADVTGLGLRTERANRVVIRSSPPPDLGGPVARLEEGAQIGPSLEPSLAWVSSDLRDGYVSPGEWEFTPIAIHLISTGTASEWPSSPGARGFIGIGFELEDGWHYGYFDAILAAEGGGVLLGWAYNSIPNAPIIARPVPEPSTWALLVGGGLVMVWFRQKRNPRMG